jgi:hypothetical protein
MNRDRDILTKVLHLQTGPPVDIRAIAKELGINLWESRSLPENVVGKLTNDPKKAGSSGFSIVVRTQDSLARKRFTIAHEIGHFFLHLHLLVDGEIVDTADNSKVVRELYRSNLTNTMEARASDVAADILVPWKLLAPLINKRASELSALFQVSREVIEIRLATPIARRLKRGVLVSPALEAEFKELVEKWHRDTRHTSSIGKMIGHPAYRRIIGIGRNVLPLLFKELSEHPDHWLVALNAITREDPAPAGSTFSEAVGAWLAWGRERGYLN